MKSTAINIVNNYPEFIAAATAVLIPVFPLSVIVGFLIAIDTIIGIWKTVKTKGRSAVTSRRMARLLTKLFIYNLLLLTGVLMEEVISDKVPFVKAVAGGVALIEFKSILENASSILGMRVIDYIRQAINKKWFPEDE